MVLFARFLHWRDGPRRSHRLSKPFRQNPARLRRSRSTISLDLAQPLIMSVSERVVAPPRSRSPCRSRYSRPLVASPQNLHGVVMLRQADQQPPSGGSLGQFSGS